MAVSSMDSFEEDNKFFKGLLDMVPARVLFDEETKRKIRGEAEEEEEESSSQHGTKKKGKQEKKRKTKCDPLQRKTVTQLQEELEQREGQSFTKLKKSKGKKQPGTDPKFRSITHDLEELRSRLQARIAELSGKKSKLTDNESKEKIRLMKKNKKLKLKLRNAQKQNKHKGEHRQQTISDDSPSLSEPLMVSEKPVYNKEGKLVFSKFDFTDSGEVEKPKTDLRGKNYKRLLEKLEKRKKSAEEVREKSADAAQKLEDKTLWKTALLKAEGEKVKDNEKLLKKAVKRKEKDKKKRQKSWESRTQQVEQDKNKRQEKRKFNLDARKKQKFEKKKKKAVKKGRLIPGF